MAHSGLVEESPAVLRGDGGNVFTSYFSKTDAGVYEYRPNPNLI